MLSSKNGIMKRFEFSTLFFWLLLPFAEPQTLACLGRVCDETRRREMPFPGWGECGSSPLWSGSSPSPGSRGVCPPALPGDCWYHAHQPGECTLWGNTGSARGGERGSACKGKQPASPRKGLILELQIRYPIAACFG